MHPSSWVYVFCYGPENDTLRLGPRSEGSHQERERRRRMEVSQFTLHSVINSASALKGRDRRYEEWKQYTDVLNPKVVRPNSVSVTNNLNSFTRNPWRIGRGKGNDINVEKKLNAERKDIQKGRATTHQIKDVGHGGSARTFARYVMSGCVCFDGQRMLSRLMNRPSLRIL